MVVYNLLGSARRSDCAIFARCWIVMWVLCEREEIERLVAMQECYREAICCRAGWGVLKSDIVMKWWRDVKKWNRIILAKPSLNWVSYLSYLCFTFRSLNVHRSELWQEFVVRKKFIGHHYTSVICVFISHESMSCHISHAKNKVCIHHPLLPGTMLYEPLHPPHLLPRTG